MDDKDVISLAEEDCTVKEIACFLGTTESNLYENHSQALNTGRDKGTASLKRKAFSMAMGGDTKMLVFLLKNRTNYREQPVDSVAEQAITILLNDVPKPDRVKAVERAIIQHAQQSENQKVIDGKEKAWGQED